MTLKNVVTWMPESSCFRTPFGRERVNGSQALLKSKQQHFVDNFPLISNKLSCEACILVGSEILADFFNTLTADHMYSCHIWEKFLQEVQRLLSSKTDIFSEYFIAFLRGIKWVEIPWKTMGKNHEEIRRVTRVEEISFFLGLTSAYNTAQ